jgi:DNA-directed RNA polymerase specialized sigma subunit
MRVRGAVWDYLRENGLVFRSRLLHGLSNISLGAMDFDYTDEPAVVMPRTQAAIDGLPPRWRDSLIRTARGETLMEVARDWGVADSRVAAVRRQAVERVRKAII